MSKVEFKVGDTITFVGASKYGLTNKNGKILEVSGSSYRVLFELGEYWCHKSLIQPKPDNLSQAELQFLIKYLSGVLKEVGDSNKYHKAMSADYWKYCDKDSGTSVHEFKMLNIHKDWLGDGKKLHAKLSEIQRKLKKQVGK